MKKRQKRNLILTAFAAVFLLAVYIFLLFSDSRKKEGNDLTIYTLEEGLVDRLEFTGRDGAVSLIKKDDIWLYEKDESFPLNQKFVETMLKKTAVLKTERCVAEGKEHFAEYGLDQPSNKITVTAGGRKKVIDLGDCNGATGDYYMTVEGTEKIYTADATFYNLFSNSILSMASRESLPGIAPDSITEFSVAEKGKKIIFCKNSSAAGGNGNSSENGEKNSNGISGWTVREEGEEQGAGEIREADSSLVMQLLSQVIKLRYEEMAVYRPREEELESCGLAKPEAELRIIWLEEEKPVTYVIRIGKKEGENRYVYAENGQGIYRTAGSSLQPFLNLTADAFLTLNVAPVKQQELERLTVLADSRRAEFTIESADGGKKIYYLNGREITEKEFNSFYYPLYGFSAEKRVSDVADQLTQAPVLTLIYDRKEEAGEDWKVELIPYDQNYYGAKVNGRAVLLVNRQKVNDLLLEAEKILR